MRTSIACGLLLWAGTAQAELSFDLRETITGHPSMVLKPTETTAHIYIQGGKIARRQNDIVQITDTEINLVTLVDYRDRKFATSSLDEVRRNREKDIDQLSPGFRSTGESVSSKLKAGEPVPSGQPAQWDGQAATRDVIRIEIMGEPGPAEWLLTIDSADNLPGWEASRRPLEATEARYDQELDAEINTLVFMNPDRFKDILKIRKTRNQRAAIPIHSVAEFRLKPGAPLLETIGPDLAGQPLITKELEVLDLKSSGVDFNIFLVPPGFEQAEFGDLLIQQDLRVF
jgi:hypothetical protein